MAWDSFLRFGVLAYLFYTLVLYPRGGFYRCWATITLFFFFTSFCIWLVGQLGGIRIDRVARAATQGTNAGATRIGPKLLERIWWLSVLYPDMVVAWDDSFLHFFSFYLFRCTHICTLFLFSLFLIPCRLSFAFSCYYIWCNIVCLFYFFAFFSFFPCFVVSCAGSHVNHLILFLPSQLSVASYSPLAFVVP